VDELRADLELGKLIDKRAERNGAAGEEREALWAESVRVHHARRREENRLAWCDYHRRLQALHQGLADEHAEKLDGYPYDAKRFAPGPQTASKTPSMAERLRQDEGAA
jgi:hypothetical protein